MALCRLTTKILSGITAALISISVCKAQDGYFTTYGHEINKGELELSLMIDHTAPSIYKRQQGQRNYLSQMPEIEYHPTSQLALEFMPELFQEFGTGISKFTGFRFEARYRLFKNEVPLNPTIYFEYEDLDPETRFKMEISGWIIPPYKENKEEPTREKVLENRLILSQNVNNWNIAINWINEVDTRTGLTAFGYAIGTQYKIFSDDDENVGEYECPMHPEEKSDKAGNCPKCGMSLIKEAGGQKFLTAASISFELIGALGDTKKMGIIPFRQEHYFQPSIMLHLPQGNMLSVGFALGLTDASDDLFRLMWMKEF